MSLDDKFNPNDGTVIDELDSIVHRFHKKITDVWQNKTDFNKSHLETLLYSASALSLGVFMFDRAQIYPWPIEAFTVIRMFNKKFRPQGRLQEGQIMEAYGLPNKTMKYFELILYGTGILITNTGVGMLGGSMVKGYKKLYKDLTHMTMLGIGFVLFVSANYVSRVNTETPPKPKKIYALEPLMISEKN